MESEPEDGSNSVVSNSDLELQMDMNGDPNTQQKNGNHELVEDDDALPDDHTGDVLDSDGNSSASTVTSDNSKKGRTSEKNKSLKDDNMVSRELLSEALELRPVNPAVKSDTVKAQEPKLEINGDANGRELLSKEGKPPVQRRMSLRPRAAPKKYADMEGSSDDELKSDPLAAKDPLEIPVGKNSAAVLIRKSPTAAVTLLRSPPGNKSPVKTMTKVARPPPELIKAPITNKISISPATSVTVVPRSKENNSDRLVTGSTNKSGFVVVDTQSILKRKSSVPASSVQASVTVSAVPSPPKAAALSARPATAPVSSNASSRKLPPTNTASTMHSTPDPFESLGLADDSFIVEAPSFVVPYLIEKMASENLKKLVETLNPPKKKEDVVELSEDEATDSEKTEKDGAKKDGAATGTSEKPPPTKTEAEKTTSKPETKKEDEDYFAGPIGRFFLDIGLSLVQEYVQGDLLRVQKRKAHKGTKIADPSLSVSALSKGLDITRAKNDPLRLPWRSCDRCNFKTESKLVLAHHWSLPLATGFGPTARFGCHWCPFEAKESHTVSAHIDTEHGMKLRTGPELPLHHCPLCPFEDQVKSKVTRHLVSCQKRFVPERNLEPPLDWEPPAKIPRLPARGLRAFPGGANVAAGLQGYSLAAASAKGLSLPYHPLVPKSALLNTVGYSALGTGTGKTNKGVQQSQAALAGLRLPAELHVVQGATQRGNAAPGTGNAKTNYRQQGSNPSSLYLNPASYAVPSNQIYQAIAKSFQLLHGQGSVTSVQPSAGSKSQAPGISAIEKLKKASNSGSVSLVPGLVNTSGLTIQSSSAPSVNKAKTNQQPSISITPLPRSTASALSNKPSLSVSPVVPAAITASSNAGSNTTSPKAGQPATAGQKGAVVCEICDGSIKDLEQLRHHMQWIHKVKIHPKMIHNRPPLNCQKCQCRFFTDQGLERHLLGSHGLVTSSMQEAANRGQDGGRCPICGKVHQWKLLSHVVKDHGLSLKPAHLSYKCTVCTATFTMYKLFENHVYTAHSVVARRVLDKDKDKVDVKKSSGLANANSTSTGTLRINDEITIIPQTARHDPLDQTMCRPSRASDKRSRVDIIDLSDDEDSKDSRTLPKSQVTITKVPAPKGYLSKSSMREPAPKRSRMDDNDTE